MTKILWEYLVGPKSVERTGQKLDVSPFIKAGALPEIVFPLTPGEIWCVRALPHEVEGRAWTQIRYGELVRVPLWPHITVSPDPADVLLAALEIAAAWQAQWPEAVGVHWAVGAPLEDLTVSGQGTGLRMWLGFAVRTK